MRTLNKLQRFRRAIIGLRRLWLQFTTGARIHEDTSISLSARLVGGAPGAISVGDGTMIAFKTLLLSRRPDGTISPISIGRHCFIGGGSVIMPGVSISDECVVGAGAIVRDNVPPRSLVVGNPARVLRENIVVGRYGRFPVANENQARLYRTDPVIET